MIKTLEKNNQLSNNNFQIFKLDNNNFLKLKEITIIARR